MDQYFYIKLDQPTQQYLPMSGPDYLPENYLGVSGFIYLAVGTPELVEDLTWLGTPGYGFWKFIDGPKPLCLKTQKITPKWPLDPINKVVNAEYIISDLTSDDITLLDTSFKNAVTPIRDQYLKFTDFTQILDVPISSESKAEYVTFRQQLRDLFDVDDLSTVVWPTIPSSALNIAIPPFPQLPKYNPDQTLIY